MKQIFTLLLVLSLGFVSYGQSFKNQPIISKRTATWCPNCGTWGWDFKLAMLEEIGADEATILALHYSGDLANETAIALSEVFGGFGQPSFALNKTNLNASSGNWSDKLDELKANVEMMNSEIPTFGIELHGYMGAAANEVVAEISLHVNEGVEGEYYIGTYLIDDHLVNNQAGNSSTAVHQKILLDEFSGTPFGREIGNGPILEGVMDFSITTTFESLPEVSTEIAVIIWEKVGDEYSVVNSGVVEGIELLSSNDDFNWVTDAKSFYAQNSINISLQSEEVIGEYKINILNTNGQVVKTVSNKTFEDNLELQLDASAIPTGNYFINMVSSNGIWSDKIVVVK